MSVSIEVTYGTPEQQVVIPLQCELPLSIEQAVRQSGILLQFPEIELADEMVGIFGFKENLDHPVADGDRVEIYRPLYLSPTEARKMRAASRKRRQNRA